MGIYVNPTHKTKEEWLVENCSRMSRNVITLNEIDKEKELVVVLVNNNNIFSAAAIAYDEDELDQFCDPLDIRPKMFFSVPIDKLKEVSDIEQALIWRYGE